MSFADLLVKIDAFLWGVPLMVLLLGAGIILTVRTRCIQLRKFPYIIGNTLGKMFRRSEIEEVPSPRSKHYRQPSPQQSVQVISSAYPSPF